VDYASLDYGHWMLGYGVCMMGGGCWATDDGVMGCGLCTTGLRAVDAGVLHMDYGRWRLGYGPVIWPCDVALH
jgi:hypothetical protein